MKYPSIKANYFLTGLTFLLFFSGFPIERDSAQAQNKVVVIPLMEGTFGPPAPVPKTGATNITGYTPVEGEDIDLQKGVSAPNPRFVDNNNGTVADRLTGLIWLKDCSCSEFYESGNGSFSWEWAISSANQLASTVGGTYCGLKDGSKAGDWRLPNRKELESLIDLGPYNPHMPPDSPWKEEICAIYWSSSTYDVDQLQAWKVNLDDGTLSHSEKSSIGCAWPVRGGQ